MPRTPKSSAKPGNRPRLETEMHTSKPQRRWFQFSVRTTLIGVAVVGIAFAAIRWRYQVRLQSLEAAVQSAEFELDQYRHITIKVPGTVTKSEMRRLELVCDRARLDVERFQAQFHWEGERLHELDRRLTEATRELAETELNQLLVTPYETPEHGQEVRRRIAAIKTEVTEAR
jgi:ribosomal protein L29